MSDDRFYPSLFDGRQNQRAAQDAASRYWSSQADEHGELLSSAALDRALDDERELRYRRAIGGAVRWLAFGAPIIWAAAWLVVQMMGAARP